MRVAVWICEGTWEACVDATPPDATEVLLLHVLAPEVAEAVHGAYAGLVGRAGQDADPGALVERAALEAEEALFAAAAARLRRPVRRLALRGRPERAVVGALADADLLVVARDGDHSRLGPRSLGPATRFVVDHAPCAVLLVWPDAPPGVETIPPPPERRPGPPPPPGH